MSEPEHLPDEADGCDRLPGWALGSEHLGTRVWTVNGSTQQELVERIAVILGEHLHDSDELHVSYNAMQNGTRQHAGYHLMKADEPWTEWFFEYSALIVLRPR